MTKLDLLLVNAPSRTQIYQHLAPDFAAVEPPVWAGLIARHCLNKGFSVEILDAEAEGLTIDQTAWRIAERAPRLAAFCIYGQQPSASTQCLPAASRVVSALKSHLAGNKQPPTLTLALGTHPSALPERTLREEPFDYICQGEGPTTITELLTALIAGDIKISQFPQGLCVKNSRGLPCYRASAPNIVNLDAELPGQAWGLLDLKRYRAHNWHLWTGDPKGGYASVQTSLGCPFKCSFCCINAPFTAGGAPPGIRFWSPENVAKQIATLALDYNITNIKIPDEMFVLNPRHVADICTKLIDYGLGKILNMWAYARIDTVRNDELLHLMRRAGFRWLGIGIESGSKHVRDGVDKSFADDGIEKAVARVRAAGLNVAANYIFGLPDDTHESMQQTLDLAIHLNTEWANFYCLPVGTPIYTPNGTKPIEAMEAGDEVLSWAGRSIVKGPMSRTFSGLMYRIKPRYLPEVRVTDEHPVLVTTITRAKGNLAKISAVRWVTPRQIIPYSGHWLPYDAVIVPKPKALITSTTINFSPYVRGCVGAGNKGGQLGGIGRKFLEPWTLTEELAELFGWYVAEGSRFSAKNNQIGFSLGANEPENIERVRYLVKACFGYKTRIIHTGNARKVEMTSKVLYRALPAMFGDASQRKTLPFFIMEASEVCTRAFLKGYIAGDGTSYPNPNGQFTVSTASEQLARQLLILFLKINIVPGWLVQPAVEGLKGIVKQRGPHYRLSWTEGTTKHYFQDEQNFYIPVASVSSEQFDGMVYNIETSDQTYGVPFIIHNCAMAYPGSPLHRIAREKGWRLPEDVLDSYGNKVESPGWLGYSQHAFESLPLPTETLSAEEVLDFRDEAFLRYFDRPDYYHMIRNKFGTLAMGNVFDMIRLGKPRRRHREIA